MHQYPPGWTRNLLPDTPPEIRAKQRASFDHPSFAQPADRAERVWRYMDLPKFVSLISTHCLYFSRVDMLGDVWEGAVPRGSTASFTAFEAKARLGGPEAAVKDWRTAWLEAHERQKWCMFVSCWQKQQYESDLMWTKYGNKPYGVAVRSTYERLDASLPLAYNSMEVLLGEVSYGDYQSGQYSREVDNAFNFFMSKRLEHQGDHEVRAIFDDFRLAKEQARVGHSVRVLLPTLVEAVVTAPGAPEWFTQVVESTCRAFGLNVSVECSALDRKPSVPF